MSDIERELLQLNLRPPRLVQQRMARPLPLRHGKRQANHSRHVLLSPQQHLRPLPALETHAGLSVEKRRICCLCRCMYTEGPGDGGYAWGDVVPEGADRLTNHFFSPAATEAGKKTDSTTKPATFAAMILPWAPRILLSRRLQRLRSQSLFLLCRRSHRSQRNSSSSRRWTTRRSPSLSSQLLGRKDARL